MAGLGSLGPCRDGPNLAWPDAGFRSNDCAAMGTPQDPRARRRQKQRRAKKNVEWALKRAAENAEAAKPKAPPKKAT